MCVCVYVCMYVYMYVCIYVCTYAGVCLCVCDYVYISKKSHEYRNRNLNSCTLNNNLFNKFLLCASVKCISLIVEVVVLSWENLRTQIEELEIFPSFHTQMFIIML